MSAQSTETDLGFSDPDPRRESAAWTRVQSLAIPCFSVILALACGGVLFWLQGVSPFDAYKALFGSALGSPEGLQRVMEKSTPLILVGLAVLIGLRVGLFNIGVQGQLLVGAMGAAVAGYLISAPPAIHIPLAIAFGMACGAGWAAIAGALRAYRGVSEIITTIMLNSIAIALLDYLASEVFKEAGQPLSRTPEIADTAKLPMFGTLPSGFVVAVLTAVILGFFLSSTTGGFRFDTVGLNPNAARYAGISVRMTLLVAMIFSGALAGLGGAIETLGITNRFELQFNAGLGFDGITIALLARANPFAAIPAALLVGILRAGASSLQFKTGVQPEIVDVILALILLFVSVPILSRILLRRRAASAELKPTESTS